MPLSSLVSFRCELTFPPVAVAYLILVRCMHARAVLTMLSVLLLGICVAPVADTSHASGRVLDSRTRRPIAGAHVTIAGSTLTHTTTKPDGSFDIPAQSRWALILPIPMDRFPNGTVA